MSEKLFKAGQSLTKAYKKFDDFAQKGLITTLKERFKGKTPISTGPVLSKSKELVKFDPKKALPSKLPSAAKKVGKLGTLRKVGRIASRVALPVAAGFEAANLAYKVATLSPEKKAKVKKLKTKLSKTSTKDYHSDLLKMSVGGDTMLKKIPEGPKGEGLRKLKAERPDVTKKMGFAKKGKMLKASMGMEAKSTKGYGAARTSGMGLQDEQLVPGKSLDYYKDLM